MVSHTEILASNDATVPQVAVFVGATSGIGKNTLRALVATGASTRIYLVGRESSEERRQTFIQELRVINPKAEEQRVTKRLGFLSAGYAPFGSRQETSEGFEVAQSLEYYSRIIFIHHLLPLLSNSETPKVVSVLGGGLEGVNNINLDDLDLRKPGNFSGMKAQAQYIVMNTVALDQLASSHPDITFIHSWPGWVNTGNVRRNVADSSSLWAWFVYLFLGPLIRMVAISDHVSAQRHLFESTSAYFGGRGVPRKGKAGVDSMGKEARGLFLVNYKGVCTPNQKVMLVLREKAKEKVWEHTQEVLRPWL